MTICADLGASMAGLCRCSDRSLKCFLTVFLKSKFTPFDYIHRMLNLTLKLFSALKKDRTGATAIEYGLIAALIGIAMIAGAKNTGKSVNAQFSCTGTAVLKADKYNGNIPDAMKKCKENRSK